MLRNLIRIADLVLAAALPFTASAQDRFNGFYTGFLGGGWTDSSQAGATQGIILGYDRATGASSAGFVYGGQIYFGHYTESGSGSWHDMYARARFGWAASQALLLYGFVAFGQDDGFNTIQYGIGTEYGLDFGSAGLGAVVEVGNGGNADGSSSWQIWYLGLIKRF